MSDTREWRERIGMQILHAMTCTHDGDAFGSRAVCRTCFENTQRIGHLIEGELRACRDHHAAATDQPEGDKA